MRRQAAEALAGEQLDQIRQAIATGTEAIAHLRGQLVNDVLATELATFDSFGIVTRHYPVPFGSVAVSNHSAASDIIVSAGPIGPATPTQGTGVQRVGAGHAVVINLASTTLTLYGVPGEQASLQIFTRPQPPTFGVAAHIAQGPAVWSRHLTLTPSVVTTVTLPMRREVELLNRTGQDLIYATTDGTTPTVAGNNTHVLPAAATSLLIRPATTSLQVISASAEGVSVTMEGVPT